MPILYSCVIDAGAIVNESGDRDSVSKWHKVANVLIERIEPRSRKSYEHEGYEILLRCTEMEMWLAKRRVGSETSHHFYCN